MPAKERNWVPMAAVTVLSSGVVVVITSGVVSLARRMRLDPISVNSLASGVLGVVIVLAVGWLIAWLWHSFLAQYRTYFTNIGISQRRWFRTVLIKWSEVKSIRVGQNYLLIQSEQEAIQIWVSLYRNKESLFDTLDDYLSPMGGLESFSRP